MDIHEELVAFVHCDEGGVVLDGVGISHGGGDGTGTAVGHDAAKRQKQTASLGFKAKQAAKAEYEKDA